MLCLESTYASKTETRQFQSLSVTSQERGILPIRNLQLLSVTHQEPENRPIRQFQLDSNPPQERWNRAVCRLYKILQLHF